ncbi:MAG: CxxC-x17-CxxC domain-containing protein [Nanoarchaeota archaeon]
MAYGSDRGFGGGRDGGRGGFRGGGGGGGGGFRRGGFNDRPREMHKITCSACGNEGEVPFKPRSGAPVFCRDCFAKQKGGSSGSHGPHNDAPAGKSQESSDAE